MRITADWRSLLGGALAAALAGAGAAAAMFTPADAAPAAIAATTRGPDAILKATAVSGPGALARPVTFPARRMTGVGSSTPRSDAVQPAHATSAVGTDVVVAGNKAGLAATVASPSDSTGAIGPNHYIEAVNITVGMYDRGLNLLSSTDLGSFIGLVAPDGASDPQIQWDQQGGRWLYSALEVGGTVGGNNFLDFGWSTSADPSTLTLNPADWCRFRIGTGVPLADFDKLGHDASQILIGANTFSSNDPATAPFQTAQVFSIPKPALGDSTCPASATATVFGTPTLPLVYPGTNNLVFTPVPANVSDATSTAYIVSIDLSSASIIGVFHVAPMGPCGTVTPPCLVGDGNVPIRQFSAPINGGWVVGQPFNTPPLDALDGRLTQAVEVVDPTAPGNRISIWTQHTSGATTAVNAQTGVTWYELLPGLCSGGTCPASARRQEGLIIDPVQSTFNASVSPDARGENAIVQYDMGDANNLVTLQAQDRNVSEPLNTTFSNPVLARSTGVDNDFTCTSTTPCRWGDYSGASPDPARFGDIWATNMLAQASGAGLGPMWQTRNLDLRRWESLNETLAPSSGPAAASWSPSRFDVFGVGPAGDLQHASNAGSGWSGWESLAGGLTAAPGAVSWAANRIDIVARGTDGQVWHISWGGTAWSQWEPLAGGILNAPDVASWQPNRLDLFAEGTDRQLWHKSWDGSRWNTWEPLGGFLNSGPGAVSWAQNRIDVFVLGGDNSLNHKSWDGASWSQWEPLGGFLTATPHVASCGPGMLDVFAPGGNHALYRDSFNGSWSGWQLVGGTWTGQPAAVCQSSTSGLNLFTEGADSGVAHAAIR
jgi:hypothetical protein